MMDCLALLREKPFLPGWAGSFKDNLFYPHGSAHLKEKFYPWTCWLIERETFFTWMGWLIERETFLTLMDLLFQEKPFFTSMGWFIFLHADSRLHSFSLTNLSTMENKISTSELYCKANNEKNL